MNRRLLRETVAVRLMLAGILAIGLAACWCFAMGIASSIVEKRWSVAASESILVTRDRQALITRNDPSGNSFRTLDGQPVVDLAGIEWANGAYPLSILKNYLLRKYVDDSAMRIWGSKDTRLPPTFWYRMCDAEPGGHAYFVGYDSHTKLLVGYLGLSGFRTDMPPIEDQFSDDGPTVGTSADDGRQPELNSFDSPYVLLASDGTLFKIDLSRRTVDKVSLPAPAAFLDRVTEFSSGATKFRVLVWAVDQIFLLSEEGEFLRAIPVPKSFDSGLQFYVWADGSSIFVEQNDVYWLDAEGKVTRHETPQLLQGQDWASYFREVLWTQAIALPSPLVLAFDYFVLRPEGFVLTGMEPTYAAALRRSWNYAWPAYLLVCLLAVASAIVCFRRQQQYFDRGAVAWMLLVLLMGPAGLAGYWLHRRWPVREHCSECGALVPRDRLDCAVCTTEMPPPALKGIEIVA